MDFPHPQNYWQGVLDSRAIPPGDSNTSFYNNPEFDAKLDEANAVVDFEASLPVHPNAGAIACNDTPLIPVYFGLNQFAWNDTVDGVMMDAFGRRFPPPWWPPAETAHGDATSPERCGAASSRCRSTLWFLKAVTGRDFDPRDEGALDED